MNIIYWLLLELSGIFLSKHFMPVSESNANMKLTFNDISLLLFLGMLFLILKVIFVTQLDLSHCSRPAVLNSTYDFYYGL